MFQITYSVAFTAFTVLFLLPLARPRGPPATSEPIPADKSQLEGWFERNVPKDLGPGAQQVLGTALGAPPLVIKVCQDGKGDFKTISEAVASIPAGNTKRAVITIAPGNYTERVRIDPDRPFVTLYGDPKNPPMLVNSGTAAQYGTDGCGTLIVEADYFNAANLIVVNSAPRPKNIGGSGEQAVAMKIRAEYGAFYNCKFYGYQDTLFDDLGKHLYKDCYVEGTVDFIFGNGQSLYLNCEIHVHSGDPQAFITAHSRKESTEPTGYVFVHCKVTGTGEFAYLGRPWFQAARVIFAYSEISDVLQPTGWLMNNAFAPENIYLGEYENTGPGANLEKRDKCTKKMTAADAKPFLSLDFIEACKWLLHPTKIQAI